MKYKVKYTDKEKTKIRNIESNNILSDIDYQHREVEVERRNKDERFTNISNK